MASPCIPTGLRLDLEMVKAAATAAPGGAAPPGAHSSPLRPAHSSASASSTLSDASHSSSTSSLSLKRARTPRKRPNQTYNEAAALLASLYPSVFPVGQGPEAAPPRLLGLASALADDPSCADLLPPFPVLGHAAFLLRDAPRPPTPRSTAAAKGCPSPAAVSSAFTEFRDPPPSPCTPEAAGADEPGELDFDDDDDSFDAADYFLAVERGAAEGIDGIMGKLSMDSSRATTSGVNAILSSSSADPFVRNLMARGVGFRHGRPDIRQALKGNDDVSRWWMCPAIPLKDIMVAPPPPPPAAVSFPPPQETKKKKSKKKALKDIVVGQSYKIKEAVPDSDSNDAGILSLKAPKTGLGLSLNTEEVLKAWCNRGSVFAEGNAPDSASTDALAKRSDVELFIEKKGAAGVIREGSTLKMQHKQKQCTPLVIKKDRYYRPRVKGRFVSKVSLLQQASEKVS